MFATCSAAFWSVLVRGEACNPEVAPHKCSTPTSVRPGVGSVLVRGRRHDRGARCNVIMLNCGRGLPADSTRGRTWSGKPTSQPVIRSQRRANEASRHPAGPRQTKRPCAWLTSRSRAPPRGGARCCDASQSGARDRTAPRARLCARRPRRGAVTQAGERELGVSCATPKG